MRFAPHQGSFSISQSSWPGHSSCGHGRGASGPLGQPGRGQEIPDPLVSFQTEIVKKLSGGSDISPLIRLENRATPENRVPVRKYLDELLKSMGLEPQRHSYRENGENVFALFAGDFGE